MAARFSNGINPDKLDDEIKSLGVRVRLYKSTVCPNVKSLESMDHNLNCTVCKNNMIDFACKETMALFQQQTLVDSYKIQGTFHIDEILATFLSGETLHHYARVDLLDFAEDFFELVQRQVGTNIDNLKYDACKVLGLFTVSNNVRIEYAFGVDFELTVEGNIKWLGSNKPADKQMYTIYYQYHPIFRAIKAVHRDRYTQYNLRASEIKAPKKTIGDNTYVKLPETWVLKRDYLIERPQNTAYDPNQP